MNQKLKNCQENRAKVSDFDTPRVISGNYLHTVLENTLPEGILGKQVFSSSVIYMVYWYHRLEKYKEKQSKQRQLLEKYFCNTHINNQKQIVDSLVNNEDFKEHCFEYVNTFLPKRKTVDLFVTTGEKFVGGGGNLQFMTLQRNIYPQGKSLPGGIVLPSDEENEYKFPSNIFAALRVAGEKVLKGSSVELSFGFQGDKNDIHSYYYVEAQNPQRGVKLYNGDILGYHYEDNLDSIIEPSDPRHLVNTTGFKMEYYGDIGDIEFIPVDTVKEIGQGDLAFEHHRKLLWGLVGKTKEKLHIDMNHNNFVQSIIHTPEKVYQSLKKRFEENDYGPDTSIPEFLPVVKYLENELFSDDINTLCKNDLSLKGWRDVIYNNLIHLHLSNRPYCPYLETMLEIERCIEFFDIVVRKDLQFYEDKTAIEPIMHDPAKMPYGRYHGYKYKYRFNDYFHNLKFRKEIMIPTFIHIGATDLMRTRGVPLRFVGISKDILFVDEFKQTPLEFWYHDLNHCRRFALEDIRIAEKIGITLDELWEKSSKDVREYMKRIIICPTDTKGEKEIKRLKKIILFEIVHEDARVFLKEEIVNTLLKREGEDVPFEWRSFDLKTRQGSVVDIMEPYIHILSYVRYKLQKGFYDTPDDQKDWIVGKEYRMSRKIAEVAYEMLVELGCKVPQDSGIDLDEHGNVSVEWLLKRTWSFGPPEIHGKDFEDPDRETYSDNQKAATVRNYDV